METVPASSPNIPIEIVEVELVRQVDDEAGIAS
jgi:hypothetical protein